MKAMLCFYFMPLRGTNLVVNAAPHSAPGIIHTLLNVRRRLLKGALLFRHNVVGYYQGLYKPAPAVATVNVMAADTYKMWNWVIKRRSKLLLGQRYEAADSDVSLRTWKIKFHTFLRLFSSWSLCLHLFNWKSFWLPIANHFHSKETASFYDLLLKICGTSFRNDVS